VHGRAGKLAGQKGEVREGKAGKFAGQKGEVREGNKCRQRL